MKTNQSLDIKKMEQDTVQLAVNSIYWLDKRGKVRHANKAACQMLGYTYDELTSMTIFDVDPKAVSKTFEQDYLISIRDKGKIEFEARHITKEGQEVPVDITVFHVPQGKEDLFCVFCFDISTLKQLMEKAIESEDKIRAIFNNHFQLTGLLDTKGRLLMANQTALDLAGVKEENVLGTYFWKTPWFAHSKMLQEKICLYIKKATQGDFVRTEFSLYDKDGNEIIVDHSFKPIKDDGGDIRFIVPEARDITQIRNAEKDLKHAYDELEKLKDSLRDENIYLKEELRGNQKRTNLVGESPAFKNVLFQIEQVAETNTTALILGETGTGKELVAHTIHDLSNRRNRPMVKLNCAAIPTNLIESELFGHEKGAFTGAHERKIGRFELADKGTLFLDEIGELTIELQVKLLRVLQENEFERIGGSKTIKVDTRIIAATNRDLKSMITNGQFREDLFYRLHVFPVSVPSLRERKDDIPILAKFLIKQISKRIGKQIKEISKASIRRLQTYHWPGNVRELINVLERAAVLSQDNTLHLGNWFKNEDTLTRPDLFAAHDRPTLDELQSYYIINILKETKGRIRGKKGASEILGIKPTTLEARMKKLGINKYEILE